MRGKDPSFFSLAVERDKVDAKSVGIPAPNLVVNYRMTETGRWTCTDGKADPPHLGTALADTQFSLGDKDNGRVDTAFLCKTSIKAIT